MTQALQLYQKGGVDFSDCLIVSLGSQHGCEAAATFDRGMRSLPGVRVM